MRAILAASLLVLSAGAAAAAEPGNLEGTITNAESKVAVPGVVVDIGGDGNAMTDVEGRFRVEGLAPGRHKVTFHDPGGGTTERMVNIESNSTVRMRLILSFDVEVIHIQEQAPLPPPPPGGPIGPANKVRPVLAQPGTSSIGYTDQLIDSNEGMIATLLLHIDAQGAVERVAVLRGPSQLKADDPAIRRVKEMRFKPARDAGGAPMASQVVYKIEWQPFWHGRAAEGLPCKGSGPMNLGMSFPAYRACDK